MSNLFFNNVMKTYLEYEPVTSVDITNKFIVDIMKTREWLTIAQYRDLAIGKLIQLGFDFAKEYFRKCKVCGNHSDKVHARLCPSCRHKTYYRKTKRKYLSVETRNDILELFKRGYPQIVIAEMLQVHKSTVSNLIQRLGLNREYGKNIFKLK